MIKCMSLFSQILSEMSLSPVSFEQLVLKHGNDRNAKGFTSKAQLVAMIFFLLFKLAASTIGAIYKERWEIELFFKTLKQTLNVKTFIGTSENALRIQIWTAMISLLIIRWLYHLSKMKWSFSVMSAMLRLNLFTYRPLPEWLDRPYETPPAVPVPEQQLIFN